MSQIKTLFLMIFLAGSISAYAQKTVSVMDDDTHTPVDHAFFILGNDTIAYTSAQGIAIIPEGLKGTVTVVNNEYKAKKFDIMRLPDVVRLKNRGTNLPEVEAVGDGGQYKKSEKYKREKREKELKNADPRFATRINIGKGKSKKERRKEKVKGVLDQYDADEKNEQQNEL